MENIFHTVEKQAHFSTQGKNFQRFFHTMEKLCRFFHTMENSDFRLFSGVLGYLLVAVERSARRA